jgi:hypothetical protein
MTFFLLAGLLHQFLHLVSEMPVQGQLWIMEAGRVRVHQPDREPPLEC